MSNSNKLLLFFIVLTASSLVFGYLTALVLSSPAITSEAPPATSMLVTIYAIALTIFSIVLFMLISVAAVIKLQDWQHYHRMVQQHREIELEKHRLQVPVSRHGRGHTRITNAPYLHTMPRRSDLHKFDQRYR